MTSETVRLRIGNLAKAVLVSGQAYQDPKDALNEFVSNAADVYAEMGRRGGRIQVLLRRKGRYPVIAVDDEGAGMSPDRLREVARNLFESVKAGDERTLGEKAIGLLAFQQLGDRCEIISRAEGGDETWTLRLDRGVATAQLRKTEARRARQTAGTTVWLSELDPDVLRVLTQRKLVDYFRARRGPALASGAYSIEVVEGRSSELVTPDEPEGVRLDLPSRPTLWGRVEFGLWVAPPNGRPRHVAVVGRAGTTIVDDVCVIEELDAEPWSSGQLSGQVVFEALQQSAGRRSILRDGEAFPVFLDAMQAVTPAVRDAVIRAAQAIDDRTAERVAGSVQRGFERALREGAAPKGRGTRREGASTDALDLPHYEELAPAAFEIAGAGPRPGVRPPATLVPDPTPTPGVRSRRDGDRVLFNITHPDYGAVKEDEPALADYLATLVAKEHVLEHNPLATPEDLTEEMVRVLAQVRRHLPKRSR